MSAVGFLLGMFVGGIFSGMIVGLIVFLYHNNKFSKLLDRFLLKKLGTNKMRELTSIGYTLDYSFRGAFLLKNLSQEDFEDYLLLLDEEDKIPVIFGSIK